MGVYQRRDSPYWWMHIETAPPGRRKVSTRVLIGHTPTERKGSLLEAKAVHHAAETAAGQVRNGRPVDTPPITFAAFAEWYAIHEIPQHRGAYRERQILPRLVGAFGALALAQVHAERVIEWRTLRLKTPTTVKHYGPPNGKPHTFPRPSARTVNRTRRTGATRMIRAGGEKVLGVVQQIGGWKDVSVLIGIYQETITEEMRAAVETVSAPPIPKARPKLRRVK
jgi:hypothetical protein